jgi:parallel beta-helix repeat protein
VVRTGDGAIYPAVPFFATVSPANVLPETGPNVNNAEKVKVTGIAGNTLTIVRAQGGTTAQSIAVGWRLSNTIFTADFTSKVSKGDLVFNVKDYGALGDGTTDDSTAIAAAWTALTANAGGTLLFTAGKYVTTGLVFQSASNFTLKGERGAIIYIAANTVTFPNQGASNIITLADCTDFVVDGLSIDGRRDTLFPLTALTANVTSGQPTITIAGGAAANYVVGQTLNLLGGLTANSGADANKQDQQMVISSKTTGGSDTITFTTNIGNAYTSGGAVISDAYGPYASNGVYITPWQTGNKTVAGRAFTQEDQQNGIHLINCQRFAITGCSIKNVWESPIRLGTHLLNGTAQTDGCAYGLITDNVLTHAYDQGIGVWNSHDITATGNVISSAGWGAIVATLSDDCTFTGNIMSDSVQRIPGDTAAGYGVALEGTRGTNVSGNKIRNSNSAAVYLTAGGTIPFGGPAQVATTVTSGSNAVALPTGTINVTSTTGCATSGQFSVLSSAGIQQISYTGKSGTTFTGCTGGVGTLYTGQRLTQYPVFINNGAVLAIAATTIITTDGTKFQVGGKYSIVDGPKTERIDVTAIATNTITLLHPTTFQHSDKCQFSQAIPESNTISGNTIADSGGTGVKLQSAIRTTVSNNVIERSGLRGIDMGGWLFGGMQPPFGTIISGNMITAPDVSADGASYQAIFAAQFADLMVTNNHCTGSVSNQSSYAVIHLQGMTESIVSNNMITDAYGIGIRLDQVNEWVCKRIQLNGNEVSRVYGEGILLYGGDSISVASNTITGSAANNGPGGYGGALDIRGVANSEFVNNVVVNNGHGGIGLDTGTINGVTVYCAHNNFIGNISRDDGLNYDAYNGALTQQGTGIKELATGQGPNLYLDNICSGNVTNWSFTSTDFQPVLETMAQLASPTFTGVPAAPTAAAGNNSTQLATTAYADRTAKRTARFTVAPYGDTRPADYTCANNTANQVEINAAIVAANALTNGGIVDLLDGTFTLGASVVPLNNVWLRGQGMFNTKVTTVSGSTFGILDNYSTYNSSTPYTNGIISDMELDGSNMLNTNGKKGFNASSLKYCKLMRLNVHDTTATGLGADDYTGVTITECLVQRCGFSNTRTITAMTYSTNTFSATTSAVHGHSIGDAIVITGMVPVGYNGVFKITSVPTTTTFTIDTSNNAGNLQLGVNPGTATTYGIISDSILGLNGIGIASGSNLSEYLIVSNNICIGNQNNNFLIEADNVGTGSNASYIFSNNISINGGQCGYRNTGTQNVQFNNNYDYGSLIGCFIGVTNISKTLTASSWAASVATFTTSTAHGFTAGQYVTVAGVTPTGYNGYFYITGVGSTTFTVAMAVDPVGAGSVFGSSQVIGHPVGATQINHNIFASPILYGIQIFAHSDGVSARGNTIKNSTFYGIYAGSGYGTISGNRIHDNGYDGIEIITGGNYQPIDQLDVSGNLIYNNGILDSVHDGINVNPNANTPITNLTLTNNHCFDNQNTKTQRYGIYLRTGSNLVNCNVIGGSLATNLTAPILISNTETTISVLSVAGTSNVGFNLGTLTSLAVTTPSAGNLTSLTVTQSDTTNNPALATLTNSGTGFGVNMIQNGVNATNKPALYVQTNASQTNQSLVWFRNTQATSTQPTLKVDSAGSGNAITASGVVSATSFSGAGTSLTGTAASLTANTVTTNANLTGDVTSSGNATTLTNAPVIAKVLTGFTSGAGTVASTDSILAAAQKLDGNTALKAPIASPTFTGVATTPALTVTNTNGSLLTTAVPDGGDFNIYHTATGTKTLAFYGSAGNIMNVSILDGTLDVGGVLVPTISSTSTLTNKTLTTPVINGTSTGTGVSSTAAASIIAMWDANKNLSSNNMLDGFTTTATATGTTALTIASTQIQVFTGTLAQTVTLPTTSVVAGVQYLIVNLSTLAVTVQSSGANTVTILAAGTSGLFTAVVATPTTAANWNGQYLAGIYASGKSLSVNNTLTLAGTDGTTQTFQGTDTIVGRATTDTLTNKRITPRINTTASSATPAINSDTTDQFNITALAAAITSMTTSLTGTPTDGQKLIIRFKDNGTARAITWGASFVSSGSASLIATTVISKTHLVGLMYDSAAALWVCVAADPVGY